MFQMLELDNFASSEGYWAFHARFTIALYREKPSNVLEYVQGWFYSIAHGISHAPIDIMPKSWHFDHVNVTIDMLNVEAHNIMVELMSQDKVTPKDIIAFGWYLFVCIQLLGE